ncbi:hypothetical protein DCC39_12385 [Pueribacillus theae]|uniref:Uncharacterized protein n=1 Tax=Pueribacillus theae TaxID=2171751 RepID=A0A2U1JXM8_9BACI|nr:hypothetical protein [Pueribacillus theae]PWA09755.1 hypothetical protein DCC39_12385 [Pueribacillus theae]
MRILLHEIRKILNWKILLILAFVNVILYFFLIEFDIKHFPNGRPALDSYRIGVEMIENYGTNMDAAELAGFKKKYDQEVRKADQFLQAREDFKEAGILSYADFQRMDHENEAESDLRGKLFFDEKVDLFWELQERERLIEFHNDKETILQNEMEGATPNQQKRLNEIKATGQYDLYPDEAFYNFQSIIRSIAITILISVVLLVSPLFIRDRARQMIDLQYTAKIGRPLYKKKVAAGLISTLLVISVLLAVYLSLFSLNHTSMFFKIPINSFIARMGGYYWYDLTFFQYIVLTIIAIYGLGIIMGLISMAVSNIVPNFITLIGVQVPIVFGLLAFGLHYMLNQIVSIWLPQWLVPVCYATLLAVSIAFIFLLWRREKKIDMV